MNRQVKTAIIIYVAILTLNFSALRAAERSPWVHHHLQITMEPAKHFIRVTDTITLPEKLVKDNQEIHFLLHGNLKFYAIPAWVDIRKEAGPLKTEFFGINTAKFEISKKIPIGSYCLSFKNRNTNKTDTAVTFTVGYEGTINHPIEASGTEYARSFSETTGLVTEEGAYLAGASFWVPWFNDELVTFSMQTTIPLPYDTVSQGNRTQHEKKGKFQITGWDSREPMDEIYLTAAKFTEYGLKVGKIDVMAFLREDDKNLANKYLETTGQYLEMYEKLIGPYPYGKFALIENFWETGYGMPSFTLLGSKIIRFPFILHSSYPHELLHNWWGNSVFVDYETGNWCEGLTAFMADHLIKQQWGQGLEYRKTTLQGYTHYAAGKKEEFPIIQFKARYDSLSSAIGYGKAMMVFHMLRVQLGDEIFKKAIGNFYTENKFKRAGFQDIRAAFEKASGLDLHVFFKQWLTRTGAPELRLTNTHVEQKTNGNNSANYRLRFTLEQIQGQEPYVLQVPVAISLAGVKEAVVKRVILDQTRQEYEFMFELQPVAVDVDAQMDVFRKLHETEIPATLSNILGASQTLILLPSQAPELMLQGYKKLAAEWSAQGKITVKMDNEVTRLPNNCSIWLLGWENLHKETIKTGLTGFPATIESDSISIENKKLGAEEKSIIVAVKNPENRSEVVVLLSTDQVGALPGLGRKLPHYGKYSYLAFEGSEPANMLKGQWSGVNSPLSATLIPSASRGQMPQEDALARLTPLFSGARMKEHIAFLTSEALAGRGLASVGLEKAAEYIATNFQKAGLVPGGINSSFFQEWESVVGYEQTPRKMRNVMGVLPGTNAALSEEAVVICAHYDHLGLGGLNTYQGNEGKIHPGADDNASGVAVLLELAHTLGQSLKPERTILFIAFTGEESGLRGSGYFVEQLIKGELFSLSPVKRIYAVVNMDSVGRLKEKDKLLVIGSHSAREWKFIFMGIGYTVGIESQMVTQEIAASDQVSFIRRGIPGVQLFSGPHQDYHRPSDTSDKIEVSGLVKVAVVAKEALVYLSERKEPLNFEGSVTGENKTSTTPLQSGRKVRTGIMPDFTFIGQGVKVGMVSPGTSAANAGIQKDDIIIMLGDHPVTTLNEYTEVLKTFNPGDTVKIVYLREGKEVTVTLTLESR